MLAVSGNAIGFSSNAKSIYANSSNVRGRFPASSTAISRYYPSTTGKATSGSLHNLWNWSSNKSWYANSSNVRLRFPASSTAVSRYADSSNIHFRYKCSSASCIWTFASSQKISGGVIRTSTLLGPILGSVADSSNIRLRFQASSLSYASYKHSANTGIHGLTTTNLRVATVSSQGRMSGQWWIPLHTSLTTAGAASTRPGQIIRTSGNANGTWVWMSIYGGTTYNWMQLTYLTGV
jgi:hypothetical protein